jgi:hypothetical protein
MAFPGVMDNSPVPQDILRIETKHYSVPSLLFTKNEAKVAIVYFHGNAMAISQMRDFGKVIFVSCWIYILLLDEYFFSQIACRCCSYLKHKYVTVKKRRS